MPYNPLYSMTPTVAPGWAGIFQSILGPIVADMNGGRTIPYVPQNMSVADASIATHINNPLYKTMMSGVYGQFGTQIGNMAGAMQFVTSLGTLAGYSPAETQRALSGGVGAFGRSFAGSMVMPFVDSGMNALGLTGGSFVAAAQAVYNSRMNLLAPNAMLNPYDAGQQHQMMSSAAAMSSMLNSILSRTADGKLMPGVDYTATQGFSREDISQVVMQAAGMGLFNRKAGTGFYKTHPLGVGNIADRLAQATGDANFDLSILGTSTDVFAGKGTYGLSDDAVRRIKDLRVEVEQQVRGLTETLGAMRDLTNMVGDEAKQMLTTLTNGNWLRSGEGMSSARDALRTLSAAAKSYNLDPKSVVSQLITNRTLLQDAAGFDGAMLSLGFNGGGMFGLAAQTELITDIEDMINARGVRGDPILSARLRQQGIQAYAKNVNSVAGRGAQVLAYARQVGAVSSEEANAFAEEMTSGDTGRLGSSLNRLLVTVFGSAEAGHRFMNNTMQMNAMRMAMSDSAGQYATMLTLNGANSEYHSREQLSAAAQRLAGTQQFLNESGMNTWQSGSDVSSIVDSIMAAIRGDGTDATRVAHAAAFGGQFNAFIGRKYDPRTALSATVSSFNRNSVTDRYSQTIDLAIKKQAAINNENRLQATGLQNREAFELTRALVSGGHLDGREGSELYRLIREDRGSEAMARINAHIASLPASQRALYEDIRADAAKKHGAAMEMLEDNAEVTQLLGLVAGKNYSGEDVAAVYDEMSAAAQAYLEDLDYDRFFDRASRTEFAAMFGDKAWEEYMDNAYSATHGRAGSAEEASALSYLKRMGRVSGAFRRAAIDTLGSSGHGLTLSNFYGGSRNAISSAELRADRDALLNSTVRIEGRSAIEGAAKRAGLTESAVDWLTGGDWMRVLNVVDPKGKNGVRDALQHYVWSFEDYEKAQARYNAALPEYEDALNEVKAAGDYELHGWLRKLFSAGGHINMDKLNTELKVLDENSETALTAEVLRGFAVTHNELYAARKDNNRTLKNILNDSEGAIAASKLWSFNERDARSRSLLSHDSGIAAFIKDLDWDEDSIKKARGWFSGAKGDFLDKLFDTVTPEEIAAKQQVEAAKGEYLSQGEAAWQIVKEGAESNDKDGKYLEVLKAARVASREGATRVYGELLIRRGDDASPATLSGQMGGL